MDSFQEYQRLAAEVPVALRNNRDRIELPVLGLQEGAGKVGSVLKVVFESGRFHLTAEQSNEVKDRLADVLWCIARLCSETGISMQELATHSITQLQARTKGLDPDRRQV